MNLKERQERTGVSKAPEDRLTKVISGPLEPCARRTTYDANSSRVREALEQGTQRRPAIAQEAMAMMRDDPDLDFAER